MFSFTNILFLIGSLFAFSNAPEPAKIADEISWKASRKLTWDDFKAKADNNDPLHALTATNIDMKAKCENGQLKLKVESVFSTNESWSKNKKSERLLFHEQLHFDITEIYARRLRKELMALPDACTKSDEINKITDRIFAEWKKQEEIYDQETNHGLNETTMKIWKEKVTTELNLLETFKYKD